jgi:WD40 repeat protein
MLQQLLGLVGSTRLVDFFVSYTNSDRAWAEWIAWQLEAVGWTTLLQAWDFRPGTDFVYQMQHAVQQADRTIAVVSPAYFGSQFGEAEWRVAFAKDPTGERGFLVPVRVQHCHPPGLLATRVYVDLVGLDEAAAREGLLAGVRKGRGRPSTPPEFPGIGTGHAPELRPPPAFPGPASTSPVAAASIRSYHLGMEDNDVRASATGEFVEHSEQKNRQAIPAEVNWIPLKAASRFMDPIVDMNAAGNIVAAKSGSPRALVYDVVARRVIFRASHPLRYIRGITRLAVSPDGAILATTTRRGVVRLWDIASQQPVGSVLRPEGDAKYPYGVKRRHLVLLLLFDPTGRRLAVRLFTTLMEHRVGNATTTGTTHQGIMVWDLTTYRVLLEIHPKELYSNEFVGFTGDGARLVTTDGTRAHVWDIASGKELITVDHGEKLLEALLAPGERRLVTTGEETVKVWDASDEEGATKFKLVRTIFHDYRKIVCAALRPDGRQAATSAKDGPTLLWDLDDGEEIYRISRPGNVRSVAFSADSRRLAIARGTIVEVWDVTGRVPALQWRHDDKDGVKSARFSEDGARLLTLAARDAVGIWTLDHTSSDVN